MSAGRELAEAVAAKVAEAIEAALASHAGELVAQRLVLALLVADRAREAPDPRAAFEDLYASAKRALGAAVLNGKSEPESRAILRFAESVLDELFLGIEV